MEQVNTWPLIPICTSLQGPVSSRAPQGMAENILGLHHSPASLLCSLLPLPSPSGVSVEARLPINLLHSHLLSLLPGEPAQSQWKYLHHGHGREVEMRFSSVQALSRVQLFATPWSAAHQASLVHHQLLECTQTHVHWVSDAIQPSHPLLSPSPPAFNLSQHQDLFKWVRSSHQVAKVLEFQHQSFQWTSRTDLL